MNEWEKARSSSPNIENKIKNYYYYNIIKKINSIMNNKLTAILWLHRKKRDA
jgi:hypothetical protein